MRPPGAYPVQFGLEEGDEIAERRVVVQGDPFGVDEAGWQWLGCLAGPVQVQAFGNVQHRQCGGVGPGGRRLAHDGLETGGRCSVGGLGTLRRADTEGFERTQEIGVLVAGDHPGEAAETQAGLIGVGGGNGGAEQGQETVEKAVVLDQVADHDRVGHAAVAEFGDEAMADGRRPGRLVLALQGFAEAFGHGVASQ